MRFFACLVGLIGLGVGCDARRATGASAPGQALPAAKTEAPVLSWHFLGTTRLAGDTNATRLREVLAQPASGFVIEGALDKLGKAPAVWLANPAATNPATAALVRPILQELLDAESLGVWMAGDHQASELAVAIRVTAERHGTLQKNWADWVRALGAGQPGAVPLGGLTAQEARWPGSRFWARWARAGDWTLLGIGAGNGQAFTQVAARAAATKPGDAWWEGHVSLARLGRLIGWSALEGGPEAEIQVAGRGANLRTTARFSYATALPLRLDPWQIPTNTITDPLISFTAAQGLRSWLGAQAWWKQLSLPTTPDQAFGWAMADIPFATYATWQQPDVTNALHRIAPTVPAFLSNNVPKIHFGQVVFQTNTTRVAWIGMPIAEPFLGAAPKEPGYVVGGFWPLVLRKTPVPGDLLSQVLGRTNLVYYDWEITRERVNGWRHLKNLYWMLAGYSPPATNHTGEGWLTETNVVRHLDNAVTEVLWASPRELTAVRTSSVGFTGFELVMLMRWLDDPAFPRVSEPAATLPQRRRERTGRTGAESSRTPGAPTPAASEASARQ